MKKVFYLLAAFVASSWMASAGTSILTNGSFESGISSTWVHNYSSGQATFSQETSVVRDSTIGLKVVVSTVGTDSFAIKSTNASFAKTSEKIYEVRFWAKSSDDAADLIVGVEGTSNKRVHYTLRDHWVLYKLPFQTTESSLNLRFYYPKVATYYIDGVEILDQNSGSIDVENTFLWNEKYIPEWGWIAGDNDVSLDLPDGRVIYFFNDSFYGNNNVSRNEFQSTGSKFLRNAMVVKDSLGRLDSYYSGTQSTTTRYFESVESSPVSGVDNFYWVGDAVFENNKIKVYLVELLNSSGGATATGRNYIAQLSYPGLTLDKVVKRPASCFQYETYFTDDDYLYLYRGEQVTGWEKYTHIARTSRGNVFGQNGVWEHYNGSVWVTDSTQTARINTCNPESVIKIQKNSYAMVSQPPLSREIQMSYAQNPQGPWTTPTTVYTIPQDEQYLWYMPNFHGQLPNGKFSVSYSTNGWEDWGNSFKDKFWYRQHYIQFDLKAMSPYTTTQTNIALNKTVTVSSTTGTNVGSYAVDGNTSTRWESAYSDPQWICVDLGNYYNVTNMKITWEGAYASKYRIQVSDDQSSWTTIKTVTGNTSLVNNLDGLRGTGRYVRIYCVNRATMWGNSIYELEINGTLIYGQDISYMKGSVSGQYSDNPSGEGIANLIDDNSLTKYLTFHSSAWVQFQTAGSYVVNKYTLTSANDAPDRDPLNWTLQGSNNGTSWTTLDTRSAQDFANRYQKKTYTFSNSTVYKYFRFNLTNNSGSILQLAEMELIGSAVGATRSAEATPFVEEPEESGNVVVYPNPVSDMLQISGVADEVQLEIYNSLGVLVKTGFGKMLNVSDLTPGLYVVRMKDGEKTINKTILKK